MLKKLYSDFDNKTYYAIDELHESDFIYRNWNPQYYSDYCNGDITTYLLNNGDIAEALHNRVMGIWPTDTYKAITWEE